MLKLALMTKAGRVGLLPCSRVTQRSAVHTVVSGLYFFPGALQSGCYIVLFIDLRQTTWAVWLSFGTVHCVHGTYRPSFRCLWSADFLDSIPMRAPMSYWYTVDNPCHSVMVLYDRVIFRRPWQCMMPVCSWHVHLTGHPFNVFYGG